MMTNCEGLEYLIVWDDMRDSKLPEKVKLLFYLLYEKVWGILWYEKV